MGFMANITNAVQVALAGAIQQPGDIKMSSSDTADPGWLLCDGSAVSRETYAALYAKQGDAYGAGDGATTFNLPDLRGRAAYGKGSHAQVDALGDSDGSAVGSRAPGHTHTIAHTHTYSATSSSQQPDPDSSWTVAEAAFGHVVSGKIHVHVVSGTTDGASAADAGAASPAFQVVNYFVKT
jgi:microcystin-dependent protein